MCAGKLHTSPMRSLFVSPQVHMNAVNLLCLTIGPSDQIFSLRLPISAGWWSLSWSGSCSPWLEAELGTLKSAGRAAGPVCAGPGGQGRTAAGAAGGGAQPRNARQQQQQHQQIQLAGAVSSPYALRNAPVFFRCLCDVR